MGEFRENTEDIYEGIEYQEGTDEVRTLLSSGKIRFPDTTGIGVKPVSRAGTERLVRAAISFTIERDLPSVTLVYEGNIMKLTEGAFRSWGYEPAKREFGALFSRVS